MSGECEELDPKHKEFVIELMKCKNQTEAYMQVYPNSSREAARSSASELLTKPNVLAFKKRLERKMLKKKIAEAEEVLTFMSAGMRGELHDRDGKEMTMADRIRCAELIGKKYGLFKDKLEVKSVNIADTLKAARERARRNGKG